jgi:hypothetical protein
MLQSAGVSLYPANTMSLGAQLVVPAAVPLISVSTIGISVISIIPGLISRPV